MKRQKGSALNAPKVVVATTGSVRSMLVSLGDHGSRRNVEVLVHPSSQGSLFLMCGVGTMGREKYLQWHARIQPELIDNLISCLVVAKRRLKSIGAAQ